MYCECYPLFFYFSFSHPRCVSTIAQTTQQLRMMFFQGFYYQKNHLNCSCLSILMILSNSGNFITQIFVIILASLANINYYLPLNIYWNISYVLKKLSLLFRELKNQYTKISYFHPCISYLPPGRLPFVSTSHSYQTFTYGCRDYI